MTNYFYRPLTFVAPYDSADENTDESTHSSRVSHDVGGSNYTRYCINQLPDDFEWETHWNNSNGPDHHTLGEFESTLDNFYNSDSKVYLVIVLHPNTFYIKSADGSFVVRTKRKKKEATLRNQSIT